MFSILGSILLFTKDDLEKEIRIYNSQGIPIPESDWLAYNEIMNFSGISPFTKASKKRQWLESELNKLGKTHKITAEAKEEDDDGGVEEAKSGTDAATIPAKDIPDPDDDSVEHSGSGVFMDHTAAIHRLNVLAQSKQAGNNSKKLRNEISAIIDLLKNDKIISRSQHKKLFLNHVK